MVTACSGVSSEEPGPPANFEKSQALVTWIGDGDTIDVEWDDGSSTTVRLIATNSPDQDECYADDALDHLIDTLQARTVTVEDFGEDQFGRTLAHVFEGDRHINLEMVSMGLSLASTPRDDDPYGRAILEAEDDAHAQGVGLWSATACGSGPVPDVDFEVSGSVINPAGPDDEVLDAEMVEIRNEGPRDISLAGWILRDESTRNRFRFGTLVLGPGESWVVSSADPGWEPGESSVWNNDGDMALLQLPDGTVVARWRY